MIPSTFQSQIKIIATSCFPFLLFISSYGYALARTSAHVMSATQPLRLFALSPKEQTVYLQRTERACAGQGATKHRFAAVDLRCQQQQLITPQPILSCSACRVIPRPTVRCSPTLFVHNAYLVWFLTRLADTNRESSNIVSFLYALRTVFL